MPDAINPCHKVLRPAKVAKRIRPVSEKRQRLRTGREVVRDIVFERDGGCVVAGERWAPDGGVHVCFGEPRTPHHRRKSSALGAYSVENLVTLCAQANDDCETHAEWVREYYPWLVVREGDAEWERLGVRR